MVIVDTLPRGAVCCTTVITLNFKLFVARIGQKRENCTSKTRTNAIAVEHRTILPSHVEQEISPKDYTLSLRICIAVQNAVFVFPTHGGWQLQRVFALPMCKTGEWNESSDGSTAASPAYTLCFASGALLEH